MLAFQISDLYFARSSSPSQIFSHLITSDLSNPVAPLVLVDVCSRPIVLDLPHMHSEKATHRQLKHIMAATSPSSSPLGVFSLLPAELRTIIYEHYFITHVMRFDQNGKWSPDPHDCNARMSCYEDMIGPRPSLLSCNKALTEDAHTTYKEAFWQNVTIGLISAHHDSFERSWPAIRLSELGLFHGFIRFPGHPLDHPWPGSISAYDLSFVKRLCLIVCPLISQRGHGSRGQVKHKQAPAGYPFIQAMTTLSELTISPQLSPRLRIRDDLHKESSIATTIGLLKAFINASRLQILNILDKSAALQIRVGKLLSETGLVWHTGGLAEMDISLVTPPAFHQEGLAGLYGDSAGKRWMQSYKIERR